MSEQKIYLFFLLSVLLKALNGVLEIIFGIALLFTSSIAGVIKILIQGELIEDPTDLIANTIQNLLPFLAHSQYSISVYLLSHGTLKILLIVGLLRKKLWAYPAAITIFSLFVVYQVYRFSYSHSAWLVALTTVDIVIIVLTWHEYRMLRTKKAEIQNIGTK